MHAAGAGDQSHPRLRQCENGVFRRDDDVARQSGFEAAAHGDAIHRRDQRLVEVEAAANSGKPARAVGAALTAGLHLQVIAGGESPLACPRDDADPQVVVGPRTHPTP